MNGIRIRQYYQLAKPGIVYGNLLTAGAAFLFAAHHAKHPFIDGGLFLATLLGLGLSMASACVFNNVIERDSDARMERTKTRALPQKEITVGHAILYGIVLGVVGLVILFFYTNLYAFLVTVFGVIAYVCLYTPAKRLTVHSTAVGALSGAVPPVVGYVAVSSSFDTNAILLFLILVCWQMPHFFAIALYRGDDYRNAGLPVMPERIGRTMTQALMAIYVALFGITAVLIGVLNGLPPLYFLGIGVASFGWLLFTLSGFRTSDIARWARKTFFYSLIVLLLLSALLAIA